MTLATSNLPLVPPADRTTERPAPGIPSNRPKKTPSGRWDRDSRTGWRRWSHRSKSSASLAAQEHPRCIQPCSTRAVCAAAAGIMTTLLFPFGASCGPTCPSDAQPTNGTITAADLAAAPEDWACEETACASAKQTHKARLGTRRRHSFMLVMIAIGAAETRSLAPRVARPPHRRSHKSAVTKPETPSQSRRSW